MPSDATIAVVASGIVAIIGVAVPAISQTLQRRTDRRHDVVMRQLENSDSRSEALWLKREELYIDFFSSSVSQINALNIATRSDLPHSEQTIKSTPDLHARFLAYGSAKSLDVYNRSTEETFKWVEMAALGASHADLRTQFLVAKRAFEDAADVMRQEIADRYGD